MSTQGYRNPSEGSQKISKNNLTKIKGNCLMIGLLLLNIIPNVIYSQVFNVHGAITVDGTPVRYASITFTDKNDPLKEYSTITNERGNYQLSVITEVSNKTPLVPQSIELLQNYPNPFSSSTAISYQLNKQSDVNVTIFDILGREIKAFRLGMQQTGMQWLMWDGKNNTGDKVVPGVYFYRLQTGNETQAKKMIIAGGSTAFNMLYPSKNSTEMKELKKENATQIAGGTYAAQITNTDSTAPRILSTDFLNVVVQQDTTLNFTVSPENIESFGIYCLQDTTLKIKDILSTVLSQLQLQAVPWLSDKDIDMYDWSSHCVYLTKDKNYFFNFIPPYYIFSQSWSNRPYILVANGKKCDVGLFYSLLSNDSWPYPEIIDLDYIIYPSDIIHIDWPFPFATDKRSNEEIKSALSSLNLLHEGLSVTIDSLWIYNADTAALKYKITIKNNDSDNLYALDPDKMGTVLFHYFTNGPIFYNSSNKTMYESIYKKDTILNPLHSYDPKWFTKIESNTSISRMINLTGYPRLPSGEYYCEYEFSSPTWLSKKERVLTDGRYWIGYTYSELIGFNRIDSGLVNPKIQLMDFINKSVVKKFTQHYRPALRSSVMEKR